jgi:hypothetical protein
MRKPPAAQSRPEHNHDARIAFSAPLHRCGILASCIGKASAAIVSTVGDVDALGTGTVLGGTLPPGPFDNPNNR